MKRRRKIFLNIVIAVIVFWGALAIFPRSLGMAGENPLVIERNTRPLLIAHGGGNLEFPDNTLEAFYHAFHIDQHVMMETDVSITKDGVVILSHDTTLDRKTKLIEAPIIEINYSDLIDDEIDFGYHNNVSPKSNGFNVTGEWIQYRNHHGNTVTPLDVVYPFGVEPRHETIFLATTLDELIKAFPNNYINVEIKQSGETGLMALSAVIALMDSLNETYDTYSRIVLASFHRDIYQQMVEIKKTSHPNLQYSPEFNGVVTFFVLHLLLLDVFFFEKVSVLQVPPSQYGLSLSTKHFINTAHRHNIAVHYWTIDDPDEMRRLIENGADGIMTNKPTLLKEVYDDVFGTE